MTTLQFSVTGRRPGCVTHSELFQHPLMEEPPTSSAAAAVRRQAAELTNRARALCSGCPIAASCLYDAVIRHDVNGFVAGTSAPERARIRRELKVTVEAEDLDSLAGVARGGQRVDQDDVVRLRRAHPDESLLNLAQRLGCSLSTVKRNLRRHREGSAPRKETAPPSTEQVVVAAGEVLGGFSSRAAA